MRESGLLNLAEQVLGWPNRDEIFHPKGGAKRVLAESADRKIGGALRRLTEGAGARVGILAPNPGTDVSDPPLALVCEFPRPVTDQAVMIEAQRLAWNFSLSPLLVTVDPHLIRSFTCCEQFPEEKDPDKYAVQQGISKEQVSLSVQAARSLHWVNLITGQFFRENEQRFKRGQRADQLLLNNLKYVRNRLLQGSPPLDEDVCHDLLARVIFIQFLMDRSDSNGDRALDSTRLQHLCGRSHFWEVLKDRDCAYDLFRQLNKRFNGDLFAGVDKDSSSGEDDLFREKEQVHQSHLDMLAELVQGTLEMARSQLCLWRQYSFDVIPLEFISSIYEVFVSKKAKGVYYTPPHLVDYVLDGVLPWDGEVWDLKIMDPACGSGVFLVKAFQRLVHRWRTAHKGRKPSPQVLRRLLQTNISGVDIDHQAVRVASFSLYLAMCDEIDPVNLWQETTFPKLRDERIVCSDFFNEATWGIRTDRDSHSYDLIVGNPAWGKGTASDAAFSWSKANGWPIERENIGPLFLPKCAALTKPQGIVSLLQPAMALLFNLGNPSQRFRKQLFGQFKVVEVTNLAAVRFDHFEASDSPACIITFCPVAPEGEPFTYICPKPAKDTHDKNLIIIDPQDVHSVFPYEAEQPVTWSALMWGGRRDLQLIRSLYLGTKYERLSESKEITHSTGIKRGNRSDQRKEMVDRRILDDYSDIANCFLRIEARELPQNKEPGAERWRNPASYMTPQLILKLSWVADVERFRSFLIIPEKGQEGVLVDESYVSVHAEQGSEDLLEVACVTFNSILAVYYFFLTDGQCTAYLHKLYVKNCLTIPLPELRSGILHHINSFDELDRKIKEAFNFSDVEWALIEDMAKFTIPYFKKFDPAHKTDQIESENSLLELYSEFFLKVLKAGFGSEKRITCVVFQEGPGQPQLPVWLMAIYLDSPFEMEYATEKMDSDLLYTRLTELHKSLADRSASETGGILFHRVARSYDVTYLEGKTVPTVYIIKPKQARYWTRSMALRDADEVAADIMNWYAKYEATSNSDGATA